MCAWYKDHFWHRMKTSSVSGSKEKIRTMKTKKNNDLYEVIDILRQLLRMMEYFYQFSSVY